VTERQDYVRVAGLLPFWRYAVGPASGHSPAFPFYRLKSAEKFFAKAKRCLPWEDLILYERTGFDDVDALYEHRGDPTAPGACGKEDHK
jgi:hypothetical protein